MKSVPLNLSLFWTCYIVGTFGPFAVTYVTRQFMPLDDSAFLDSWLSWLFGACLLICCVWSVRTILLRTSEESQRPLWFYRLVGWLALAESVFWASVFVRMI